MKCQFAVQSTLFSKYLRACLFLSTDFESLALADEAVLSVAGSGVQLAASCSLQAARCMLHAACCMRPAACRMLQAFLAAGALVREVGSPRGPRSQGLHTEIEGLPA